MLIFALKSLMTRMVLPFSLFLCPAFVVAAKIWTTFILASYVFSFNVIVHFKNFAGHDLSYLVLSFLPDLLLWAPVLFTVILLALITVLLWPRMNNEMVSSFYFSLDYDDGSRTEVVMPSDIMLNTGWFKSLKFDADLMMLPILQVIFHSPPVTGQSGWGAS